MVKLAANPPADFVNHIADLARQIWEGHDFGGVDPTLIQTYGNRLEEAIQKGYGQPLVNIDFDTPDHELVKTLLDNTWQFSAAKSYAQLRDMSEALVGPDGRIRSWKEYRKTVGDISGKHLGWLRTEYDSAIAGAQMAKKWKQIWEQRGILPLLQFDAVLDGSTTDGCRSLDGIILPVEHWLWDIIFPLNHFRCRSTVRQLRNGEITPDSELPPTDWIPAMFRVNLGKRGLAFPSDHAYFDGMPPEVYEASRRYFPYERQFDIMDLPQGHQGMVRQHFMTDTGSRDYQRVWDIAQEKAKDKVVVDILPTLNPDKYPAERNIIFKGAKKNKSPDLRIDNTYVEEEGSSNSANLNNIKHAIDEGYRQANHVIVSLSQPIPRQVMERVAKSRFIDHKDLNIVEFWADGKFDLIRREDLLKSRGQ